MAKDYVFQKNTLTKSLFNPFMYNVVKWPNIFLKYVCPFYNISMKGLKYGLYIQVK